MICRAISSSDICVCWRRCRSRIVARMSFSAEPLTAGLKPQNNLSFWDCYQSRPKADTRGSRTSRSDTAPALYVLAVGDLGFRRVHLKPALCQARLELDLEGLGFLLGPAVDQSIIRIPTPREVGVCPRHPEVERVVQKQIG